MKLTQEIIAAKRDGAELAEADIRQMIAGLTDGSVSEGQAAAFAMAIFFRDMDAEERGALTLAMRDSGTVLDWRDLPGPALDKHSTGGVGDTVSLPLVAQATKIVLGEDLLAAGGVDWKSYAKMIGERPHAQKVAADRKADQERVFGRS